MAEPAESQADLTLSKSTVRDKVTGIEIAAVALSGVWLLISGGYVLLADTTSPKVLQFVLLLMLIVFPVAMIWVAATAARASRIMREESTRLEVSIEAMRKSYIAQNQSMKDGPLPTISRRLDELLAGQKRAETTLAMITSTRVAQVAAEHAAAAPVSTIAQTAQPALALGTPSEEMAPPLSRSDFIRALHFPETAEDEEGFAALRRALKDRPTSQLVQASQDVLTLLSQEGIYMDDLRPDIGRPEVWRRFAQGERGRAVAALGGVRDRSSLALTAGRMKTDPIFRDAVHHFLRVYDKSFVQFEDGATDEQITAFADTRTSRAFMLLGRVAGTFD